MTEPIYAFRRKGQKYFCTCYKHRYDELAGKPDLFEVAIFYTAPPKAAEWVGLTDEELAEIDGVVMKYIGTGEYVIDGEYEFARAIETKLREKNT
jgi:hypothetical protein